MAEKFTPGPWQALTNGNAYNSETVVTFKDAADGWICSVYDDCDTCALPDDANAHLIAAAPELYEALKDLAEQVGKMSPNSGDKKGRMIASLCGAADVLAKARGEHNG